MGIKTDLTAVALQFLSKLSDDIYDMIHILRCALRVSDDHSEEINIIFLWLIADHH